MQPKKTNYYTDELHDDFAATQGIHGCVIPDDFPYIRKSRLWNFTAFLAYRCIVTPLAWLYCKIFHGLRIQGKKNLRGIRSGYCLYGNHTQYAVDAFVPTLISFPRKAHILTGPDAVSLFGLRTLVQMLGGMPLPTSPKGLPHLADAVQTRLRQGRVVCAYPEAHIWPYYTHIRPFSSGSFAYPVRAQVPAVPYVLVYRPRRVFRRCKPCITICIGKPIYPDPAAPPRAERQRLRDEAYTFMRDTAESIPQPEYIRYVRADDTQ